MTEFAHYRETFSPSVALETVSNILQANIDIDPGHWFMCVEAADRGSARYLAQQTSEHIDNLPPDEKKSGFITMEADEPEEVAVIVRSFMDKLAYKDTELCGARAICLSGVGDNRASASDWLKRGWEAALAPLNRKRDQIIKDLPTTGIILMGPYGFQSCLREQAIDLSTYTVRASQQQYEER